MRFRIKHITHYQYAQRVTRCYNLANVIPRNTDRQQCLNSRISVSPQPATKRKRTDYFGNQAYHFEIQEPHTELTITAESDIQIQNNDHKLNLDLGASYGEVLDYLRMTLNDDTILAREFLLNSPMIEASTALAEYARPSFDLKRSLKACVSELTTRIFNDFTYDPEFTTIATPLGDVLEHKRGVCQDFAHLQIGCLRAMGIPAKYVSGYIETLPKPGEKKLVGADATHAWMAYFSPSEGWAEFDPTNNTAAHSQHIVTAFGRDYFDVTPVKGVIFGGGKGPILSVSVDVSRLPEI
ncbi:transglutaminase family protein [Teredinibacter purpureus]|uniref:transglutaminase family protein n=1 Tax=Teredinibacter purpureus TaxID=2731756 RepID=UPI0005F86E08|nr:transglutaminase family protein [Teredinibacter purpureus]